MWAISLLSEQLVASKETFCITAVGRWSVTDVSWSVTMRDAFRLKPYECEFV